MSRYLDSLRADAFGSLLTDAAVSVGLSGGSAEATSSDADAEADSEVCRCSVAVESPTGLGLADRCVLVVDADDCPGRGRLEAGPACRATVVDALVERDVDAVRTRHAGRERTYVDAALALLVAAGRFVERAAVHDADLADRARRDPLSAAHRATGRAGAVARIAAECGLAELAARVGAEGAPPSEAGESDAYERALDPFVGPTISRTRVSRRLLPGARVVSERSLPTGAVARICEAPSGTYYHLTPATEGLDADATATLATAYDVLANGSVGGGSRAPGRAVRRVAGDDEPIETLSAVLARHTRGLGVFEHLFADEAVSDVVASAPVVDGPVRVVVDGERFPTNVHLTPGGAAALASRFRRESGRAFSRSSPALDASVVAETGRRIRVAGVTAPASDGVGFAFRVRDDEPWTLGRLVAAGSLSARAAAFLSLAVERGSALIVAGTRGAGKTTLLGALLWALPAATRLVTIEDTPELPVESLRERGRDVQALHTDAVLGDAASEGRSSDGFAPTDALRAALRLGDGALAVGEVRGEEAGALYEAMRVGAQGHAVLGTIHGDSAAAVRERVVSDLGVPPSSFGATDLVVTCTRDGDARRVSAIEAVETHGGESSFPALFARDAGQLRPSGRIERGESAVVDRLRSPGESYAEFLAALGARTARIDRLATTGLTRPADLDAERSETR
ncbi:ATPase, T2SS/T4P/T4SS family [Halobellus rubicundus]|uniref:ATPase, T2SS/T4P/T4SS family n=1 Tax=Halobellus rubicundus TaxID=2996466 RepID=A0ABD5ME28_9EURY